MTSGTLVNMIIEVKYVLPGILHFIKWVQCLNRLMSQSQTRLVETPYS